MQLVLLHYHLNRGGVTSVVENHLRSLALLPTNRVPTRVAIVTGGRAAAWNHEVAEDLPFECSLITVPELEYDHLSIGRGSLYKALQSVLQTFDRDSTILHVHNHSLGKNAAIASVLGRLADEGWRQLLQIHDFAEDLRPANYQHLLSQADSAEQLQRQLYPQAAHIHYAVLNQRDHQVLAEAGVREQRLHLLPNPVKISQRPIELPESQETKQKLAESLGFPVEHPLVLYPVRAIRRKNLGEILLWSLLADHATFAVTLAPLNPQEIASYQSWVKFAAALGLPVIFDFAKRTNLPFEAVYAAADAIITTSVAEGFGMVYLEASLAGRPLVGRELPGVCNDFLLAGMEFPGLADTMAIPASCFDLEELRQTHDHLNQRLRTSYGLAPEPKPGTSAADLCFSEDTVDFGRLESKQQKLFLRHLKDDAELRQVLREMNPTVQRVGEAYSEQLEQILANNCRVIATHYSPEVIGEKLSSIYRSLLSTTPERVELDPRIARFVLDRFVHPSLLYPIRLES